MTVKLKTNVSI